MRTPTASPFVSAEWLAEHLEEVDTVVLDATFFLPGQRRNPQQEYLAAHIPGAHFFDVDAIADHNSSLPHMLPSEDFFAESVGRLGIGRLTQVVTYDNNDFLASARVWWTFRAFGHDRVSVLDGGMTHWRSLGYAVEAGQGTTRPREFVATFQPELVRGLQEMKTLLHDPGVQILDARAPGRFAGIQSEPRAGLRPGHIPGSRNLLL